MVPMYVSSQSLYCKLYEIGKTPTSSNEIFVGFGEFALLGLALGPKFQLKLVP